MQVFFKKKCGQLSCALIAVESVRATAEIIQG